MDLSSAGTSFVAAVCIGLVNLGACSSNTAPLTSITYQGMTVPTARPYADIDAFEDDEPAHLSTQAVGLLEARLRAASFGPRFSDRIAMSKAFDELRVPGYGSFYANQWGVEPSANLELMYVEVPQRSLNRYIVVSRERNGSLAVLADFIAPASPELVGVRRGLNGLLEFLSPEGAVVERRSAAP